MFTNCLMRCADRFYVEVCLRRFTQSTAHLGRKKYEEWRHEKKTEGSYGSDWKNEKRIKIVKLVARGLKYYDPTWWSMLM